MKSSTFTLDPLFDVLSGALFDTKQLDNRDGYETTKLAGHESSELGTNHLVGILHGYETTGKQIPCKT